jgi:hypothetical protein
MNAIQLRQVAELLNVDEVQVRDVVTAANAVLNGPLGWEHDAARELAEKVLNLVEAVAS